jgi:hypothetical protein
MNNANLNDLLNETCLTFPYGTYGMCNINNLIKTKDDILQEIDKNM